jgi:hypothetical protein
VSLPLSLPSLLPVEYGFPLMSTPSVASDAYSNFPNPSKDERRSYAVYWQHKLAALKSDIIFPDSLLDLVAAKTHGFSFAYLKEAL